jgi:hypothetical protein
VRRKSITRLATFAAAAWIAALLIAAQPLRAQQPAAMSQAGKAVPDNLAEQTPPAQPIPYSHQTHLALGLECRMCHANPAPGNLMTFPSTTTCMGCHSTVATDKPSIQKLAAFAISNQPIPWVRVYAVTKGVNWTHSKHLDAGMKCETCHGQVAEMAAMSQTTSVTSMGVCISCHKLNSAPTVCQTCHSWPAGEQ